MKHSENWDRLLRQALASTEEPDEKLNENIIKQLKERNSVKRVYKKRISAGVLVAVFALVMSITALAATQLFSSKEVAEHLGEGALAEAFESNDAIEINETAAAGGYNITLHGVVSGAGLKELDNPTQPIHPERTYAVVSIAREDGVPMPHTSDPEYGKEPFFISPLIKGLKPWQVNIVTMSGGYNETVVDGIMYRLIECDGIEIFADQGVYLAVSNSVFYKNEAFTYDENTGEITARTDYDGISVLFDLPLDQTKADPVKAEAYVQELLNGGSTLNEDADAEEQLVNEIEALKEKKPHGTVIPESIQEVTFNDQGLAHYEYDDWSLSIALDQYFEDGQTGFSEVVSLSGDGTHYKALQFHKDEDGVVTGRIVILD